MGEVAESRHERDGWPGLDHYVCGSNWLELEMNMRYGESIKCTLPLGNQVGIEPKHLDCFGEQKRSLRLAPERKDLGRFAGICQTLVGRKT